jgi:hypothetical protein
MKLRNWETWVIVSFSDGEKTERRQGRHFTKWTAEWSRSWSSPRTDLWALHNTLNEIIISDVRFEVRRA